MKLPLDSRQIIKNICVVEFEVVQNRGARTVVDKLAAFVKKRGVVLVGFYNKWCPLHLAIGTLRTGLAQARLS